MTIAAKSDPTCPIYNVGSPHAIELQELATKIADRFSVPTIFSDHITEQIDCYIPNVDRAMNQLGLDITIPLDTAINRTIDGIVARS